MIKQDINYIKDILPSHYEVKESKKSGSVHCKSRTGLRSGVEADDDEHWSYIQKAIKAKFGKRLQEIDFNTNAYYQDFTIYLKN